MPAMTPPIVILEWYELVHAMGTGMVRSAASMSNGHNPSRSVVSSNPWEIIQRHCVGAAAELAVAKFRGVYWDGSVGTYHAVTDVPGCDVRSTPDPNGSLILRDDDPADRWYCLVITAPPSFRLVGFIRGEDGRRDEWLRNPHGQRASWFVPQAALLPIRSVSPQ